MQPQVGVVGGGFGGLEAAFLLRQRLGERVGVTVICPEDAFAYRPGTVYVPFGADPQSLLTPLAPSLRRRRIPFVHGRATALDPGRRELAVQQADGTTERLRFDYLIVATGAQPHPAEVPGLLEHGWSLWSVRDAMALRRGLATLTSGATPGRRDVLLVVPRGNRWPGPLYELALMLDTWLRRTRLRRRVGITLATHEHGFLHSLGPRMDTLVRRQLERRGITGFTRAAVEGVAPGEVCVEGGLTLRFDLLVSIPAPMAAAPFAELPRDPRGFIMTTTGGREVLGAPRVFAVGDAAAWPVKQALVAVQQAGAAVRRIEAEVTGREPALEEPPHSLWLMDQMDTGSFAQVPLTDGGEAIAEYGESDGGGHLHARVGTSSAWRFAKRFVGLYVPWRYRHGLPCHGGFSGSMLTAATRVMAGTLAH